MVSASSLSLILPTLNECDNVVSVMESVLKCYPTIGQIIVVDDDSTDGTLEAVETHFVSNILKGQVTTIHRTSDPGLTPSLRDAVKVARCPHVGWMDCDGSSPVETLGKLLEQLRAHDLVVASRFAKGGSQKPMNQLGKDSFWEIILSNILNGTLDRIFRLPISDLTSGFIVMKSPLAKRIRFRGSHGEYFIFLLLEAQQMGARMAEVPYACRTRQFGKSKTFGSGRAVALNLFRYSIAFVQALWIVRTRAVPSFAPVVTAPKQAPKYS